MAENINGSVCLNHPDRPAIARCAVCRKPVCAECAKKSNGSVFCSKECYDNAISKGALAENVLDNKKKVESKPNYKGWITGIVIVVVIVAGFFIYKANKRTIDRKIWGAKRDMKIKYMQEKNDISNKLIKDSKYKKQRQYMVQ